MELEEAIRGRRTHKAYGAEPVDRSTLDELLELARWAPNHHLTNPWRFRVIGPEALARLKQAAAHTSSSSCSGSPVWTTLATISVGARSSLPAPSASAHAFSRSTVSGPSTLNRHGIVRWWFGAQRASSSSSSSVSRSTGSGP